jgi:hypothetical protein
MIYSIIWLVGIPIAYTILTIGMKSKPQAEQFSQEQTLIHALFWPVLILFLAALKTFNYIFAKLNSGVEWIWMKLKE